MARVTSTLNCTPGLDHQGTSPVKSRAYFQSRGLCILYVEFNSQVYSFSENFLSQNINFPLKINDIHQNIKPCFCINYFFDIFTFFSSNKKNIIQRTIRTHHLGVNIKASKPSGQP